MPENFDIEGIIRHVAEVIIGELKLEDVTADTFNPDMDLVDELGIDSMDLATIALVLQDEYKIVIDEDDYPKLKTIRLIADYIKGKLAARSLTQ
jgi:acyl carrier protein